MELPFQNSAGAAIDTAARRVDSGWRGSWDALGLQGKLIFSFTGVLALALGMSCWLFLAATGRAAQSLVAAQATELSRALGMASQTPLGQNNLTELTRIGTDLLKHRDVVVVAFFDVSGRVLSLACQDPDVSPADADLLPNPRSSGALLLDPQFGERPALGRYVRVTAPVVAFVPAASRSPQDPPRFTSRVVGYVSVCISQTDADAAVRRARSTMILISALLALASLPLAYALVYRLFVPIRRLVTATDRIAAGELDEHVAADRRDVIGTLARSFQGMVQRVRRQQEDLARANVSLAEANHDLEFKVCQRTAELEAANRHLSVEIAENESLRHDLERAMQELRDQNGQLEKSLRRVEDVAATDPLTGLYNRRHFGKVLAQLFGEAQRYDTDLSCVMIDLDGYKLFNDTYGHQTGDQLLVVAAKVITSNLRVMDVAARYGGDEFIILLPHAAGAEAAGVAARIHEDFCKASSLLMRRNAGVTMSIGIGSLRADAPAGSEQLVACADAALYGAKKTGRNRIVISDPALRG